MRAGGIHAPIKQRACDVVLTLGNRIIQFCFSLNYKSSSPTAGELPKNPPTEPGASPALLGPPTPIPSIPCGTKAATKKVALPKPAGRKRG
jgi:hypothetical protein